MRRTKSIVLIPTVIVHWHVRHFKEPSHVYVTVEIEWLLWGKSIRLWRRR
jgi:hypothetical protein